MVFDGRELRAPGTVVIDGDRIGTDPSGAREIDSGGAVLMPGLIDAHVHLSSADNLRQLCEHGVTTALAEPPGRGPRPGHAQRPGHRGPHA
ncbi:hypothetical protein ACWGLP_05175 [Streptomyces lydicus]